MILEVMHVVNFTRYSLLFLSVSYFKSSFAKEVKVQICYSFLHFALTDILTWN